MITAQTEFVVICRQTGVHLRPATDIEIAEFCAKNQRPSFERATVLDSGVLVDTWNGYGAWYGGAGF